MICRRNFLKSCGAFLTLALEVEPKRQPHLGFAGTTKVATLSRRAWNIAPGPSDVYLIKEKESAG